MQALCSCLFRRNVSVQFFCSTKKNTIVWFLQTTTKLFRKVFPSLHTYSLNKSEKILTLFKFELLIIFFIYCIIYKYYFFAIFFVICVLCWRCRFEQYCFKKTKNVCINRNSSCLIAYCFCVLWTLFFASSIS